MELMRAEKIAGAVIKRLALDEIKRLEEQK